MCANVTREPALRDSAIRTVRRTVGVDLVGAVILVVRFAVRAGQIGRDLCTNTSTIADLKPGDLRSNFDDLADNLVSYTQRERNVLAPATGDRVNVRGADTASVYGDIDIVVLELLKGKLQRCQWLLLQDHTIQRTSWRLKLLQFLMSVMVKASVVSG
jgi:hypothetical protein